MDLNQILMIVLPLAGVLLQAMHARGVQLPILSAIFDLLNGKSSQPTVPGNPSAPASSHPLLAAAGDAIRKGLSIILSHNPVTGETDLKTVPTVAVKAAIAALALFFLVMPAFAAGLPPCEQQSQPTAKRPCDNGKPSDPPTSQSKSVVLLEPRRPQPARDLVRQVNHRRPHALQRGR